jgi:hypothetical protein
MYPIDDKFSRLATDRLAEQTTRPATRNLTYKNLTGFVGHLHCNGRPFCFSLAPRRLCPFLC